jgi:hypothetical protein
MDLHSFSKQDPDPHPDPNSHKRLDQDPDLHKVVADPDLHKVVADPDLDPAFYRLHTVQ